MLAQEGQEALGGDPSGEILEVVVSAVVAEVHHALHHQRVERAAGAVASAAPSMSDLAQGGGLHLQAQRLAHVLGDEAPVLHVLDDLVAAPHGGDVDAKRKVLPGGRKIGKAIAVLGEHPFNALPPLGREHELLFLQGTCLPERLDDLFPLRTRHVALGEAPRLRDTLVQLRQEPVLLPFEGNGARLEPGLLAEAVEELEVLEGGLPVAGDAVGIEVLLNAVRELFAGVVKEQPLGGDHIAQVCFAGTTRADPGHGDARWVGRLHDRQERVRRCDSPHVRGPRDEHAKLPTSSAQEGAERNRQAGRALDVLPTRARQRARVDLPHGLVFERDRRQDDDVGLGNRGAIGHEATLHAEAHARLLLRLQASAS